MNLGEKCGISLMERKYLYNFYINGGRRVNIVKIIIIRISQGRRKINEEFIQGMLTIKIFSLSFVQAPPDRCQILIKFKRELSQNHQQSPQIIWG